MNEPLDRVLGGVLAKKEDLPRIRDAYFQCRTRCQEAREKVYKEAHKVMATRIKSGHFEVRPNEPALDKDGNQQLDEWGQPMYKGAGPKPEFPEQMVLASCYTDPDTHLAMERYVRINPGDSTELDAARAAQDRVHEEVCAVLRGLLGL